MREVVFYYDIVCPFAYLASRLVENLGRRNGAKIKWRPVLLGKSNVPWTWSRRTILNLLNILVAAVVAIISKYTPSGGWYVGGYNVRG